MEEKEKSFWKIIKFVSTLILPLIITDIGLIMIKDFPDKKYIGILIIIFAVISSYVLIYAWRISKNEDEIKELTKKVLQIEGENKNKERLLKNIEQVIIEDFIKRIKR